MIVLGFAQRTVFLEPASTSLSASIPDGAPYAVIDASALAAHAGPQTLTISGGSPVFMAYGRSEDVRAWVDGSTYSDVSLKKDGTALKAKIHTAPAPETPSSTSSPSTPSPSSPPAIGTPDATAALPTNPAGSDLWLEEFSAQQHLTRTINVPAGISVIVASDGTKPAPTRVSVEWPTNNATPWAGPLIVGGAVLALIGLALYLWALLHLRRSQGPRRNLPRGPRMPKLPRAPRPKAIKASEITGPRRSMIAIVPVLLVSGLVLTGCSPDFWPSSSGAVTPTASPTLDATAAPDAAADIPLPAVTVPQLEQIVHRIAAVATEADTSLSSDAIATRFTGPALEQRLINYKIRAVKADVAPVQAIPDSTFALTLPQQSPGWPRMVMTVVEGTNPKEAPTALVLTQQSPRANYLVEYAIQLVPAAPVPDVAPAAIGAPIIKPDVKLLVLPPDKIAAAYGDVLQKGEASEYSDLFEVKGDTFRAQVQASKDQTAAELPSTAAIEYSVAPGSGQPLALATNDSGGIVAVNLNEIATVRPVDAGATVSSNPDSASAALSGVASSAKGLQSTYSDQLLFHVPAAGSGEKIVLLGFAQGLIASVELP
nr:hypothetical protein [Leifsonia psychrotolerans]